VFQTETRVVADAAQNTAGKIEFNSSLKSPAPPKDPAGAPAGTVAEYTGPATIDLSTGERMISAHDKGKRFAEGWCFHCSGFNHRAVDCAARKKTQMFRAAGAEIKKVRTGSGPEDTGNKLVN